MKRAYAGFRTVADHAASVYACACDPGLPPADLDRAIAYLRLAVDGLALRRAITGMQPMRAPG